MASDLTQRLFVVCIRAFHNQQVEIWIAVQHLPEAVRIACVTGKCERPATRCLHPVADRRLGQAQLTGARVLLSACQQCKRTLMAAAPGALQPSRFRVSTRVKTSGNPAVQSSS